MSKISVIIPCHNEARTIKAVIEKIPSEVMEIIVVDNNSSDDTAIIATKSGARVVQESTQGYGIAIRRGLREAQGDILVVLDGDDQYPAERILDMEHYLEKNNLDFISAARFPLQDKKSLPGLRKFGNLIFNFATNFIFGTKIKDSQSGMWVFRREVLDRINLESLSMSLSEELKLRVINEPTLQFSEYPITYRPRISPSKLLPWKHGWANLVYLFKLKREFAQKDNHPILFLLGLLVITTVFIILASLHINAPFFHVTADVNGQNGVAAINIVENGARKMKFGAYNMDLVSDPIKGNFYIHHPAGYVWPTVLSYRLFGVSELTTRLGPLVFMLVGIWAFGFGLRKVFYPNIFKPLAIVAIFSILPGVIFYGETFELAIFSLPAAFISWSFFVSWALREDKVYLFLFFLSILLGGLVGWFFYLMIVAIWLMTLFSKKIYGRTKLLIITPLVAIFAVILNFLHFYWLNGQFFSDLSNSLMVRVARPEMFKLWFLRVGQMSQFHFTMLFLILALLGLILFIRQYSSHRREQLYLWPWFIMPILVFLIFTQWSTHPFGVIFLAPLVAILVAWASCGFIEFINDKTKEKLSGILIVLIVLFLGLSASINRLDYFFNDFIILAPADLELMKKLAPEVTEKELCLGQNSLGIDMGGIIEWNLGKNIGNSPACLEAETNLVLIFNPRFGEFYANEAQLFLDHGFYPLGCSGNLCLLKKGELPD